MLTRRGFLKFLGRGFLALAALGGYAFAYEPMGRPRVTHYALTPPRWTPGLKLKIAVLTDFHACEPWMSAARIETICDQANALDADIILLLGDYVSSMRIATGYVHSKEWSRALSRLAAPLGVHAILGNHDWWADLAAQQAGGGETFAGLALREVGIPVYDNAVVRLEKDGNPFWLAGLSDQMALKPSVKFNRQAFAGLDDLPDTLKLINDDAPVLLMAHEPDIFPSVSERVSLTLSGHTHGGQVNFFGWTPVVPSRYGSRYVKGHKIESGRHIIVSRGLGCSGLPVRFGSWPEILLIELG